MVNALDFSGTNFVFSRFTDYGKEEQKRHDLALQKLQSTRNEWDKDRKNEAKAYINNVD